MHAIHRGMFRVVELSAREPTIEQERFGDDGFAVRAGCHVMAIRAARIERGGCPVDRANAPFGTARRGAEEDALLEILA